MCFSRILPLTLAALFALGMGEPQTKITIRFFAQANSRDGDSFSTPVKVGNPPRDIYIQKVPALNERQIVAIYPFPAKDGSWGCAFKLDNDGRIGLEVVSTDKRGSSLICFVATKTGTHQVADLLIDKTVRDGIISVPHGFTELEIAIFRQEYKVLGETGEKPKKNYRLWNPFRKKDAA